jgi:CRP/FNR family cyclic AMP-dependent transcriptional regulator
MAMTLDTGTVLALLGVGFSFLSFIMKGMVPLRLLALAANVCFIGYGAIQWLLPSMILNIVLLPVNVRRLWEIRKLSREISRATADSPITEWLLPHMRRVPFKKGQVLFRKGDVADRLIYLAQGQLRLEEIGQAVHPGELVGEIGLFSPDKTRTQTLVCDSDGEIYDMSEEMIFQLYYVHPKLGFYLMRLVTARLLRDVQRHQAAAAA